MHVHMHVRFLHESRARFCRFTFSSRIRVTGSELIDLQSWKLHERLKSAAFNWTGRLEDAEITTERKQQQNTTARVCTLVFSSRIPTDTTKFRCCHFNLFHDGAVFRHGCTSGNVLLGFQLSFLSLCLSFLLSWVVSLAYSAKLTKRVRALQDLNFADDFP